LLVHYNFFIVNVKAVIQSHAG